MNQFCQTISGANPIHNHVDSGPTDFVSILNKKKVEQFFVLFFCIYALKRLLLSLGQWSKVTKLSCGCNFIFLDDVLIFSFRLAFPPNFLNLVTLVSGGFSLTSHAFGFVTLHRSPKLFLRLLDEGINPAHQLVYAANEAMCVELLICM